MASGIYFKKVLKTITTHTGTKIEHAMAGKAGELMTKNVGFTEGGKAFLDHGCDKGKIITFAENSPMKKLGFDQAYIGFNNELKSKSLSLWQDGNVIQAGVIKDGAGVDKFKNLFQAIKDLVSSNYKLPPKS